MKSEMKSDVKTDDDIEEVKLDDNNESIKFVLENVNSTDPSIQRAFLDHAHFVTVHTEKYGWAVGKRIAFGEGTWKQMGRRMTLMKKEGFDIRSNTKKAKTRRTSKEVKESKLDQHMKNKDKARKKRKMSRGEPSSNQ